MRAAGKRHAEGWAWIPGWERLYLVSTLGRVISIPRIANTTFGEPQTGMQCCHYDGDRTNAALDNLRWDTVKANHADKKRHGTYYRKRTA